MITLYCQEALDRSDSRFTVRDGILLFNEKPFNGRVENVEPVGRTTTISSYKDGLLDGKETVHYDNGQVAAERYYRKAKLVNYSRSWRPDGSDLTYAEYRNGLHHGDFWSWHANGHPYQYARYKNGKELGRKVWRASGQIYANYVNDGKEIHGFAGSKLCDPVNEQLEAQKKSNQ